jgi:hypothetical protein
MNFIKALAILFLLVASISIGSLLILIGLQDGIMWTIGFITYPAYSWIYNYKPKNTQS